MSLNRIPTISTIVLSALFLPIGIPTAAAQEHREPDSESFRRRINIALGRAQLRRAEKDHPHDD